MVSRPRVAALAHPTLMRPRTAQSPSRRGRRRVLALTPLGLGGVGWGWGSAPGPHRPRSHLHLDLRGHLGRGWWGGERLSGSPRRVYSPPAPQKVPRQGVSEQAPGPTMPCLGPRQRAMEPSSSTSQSSLPEAGAKDGGSEGEDGEEAGQSHTESVLPSLPFTPRESHSRR